MNELSPENISNKRVLFSPLNWGMGHVSRSIGLIHTLLKDNNFIFIACNDEQRKVYEEYFPDIRFIKHEGYPFNFKGGGKFSLDLLLSSMKLVKRLKIEKEEVLAYVERYNIDIILSDHRYGFYHEQIPSIFITHQINLPVKWYQKNVQFLHEKLMKNFERIWIMDFPNSSLAGKLSEAKIGNVEFIGPFSRFMLYDIPLEKNSLTVFIASGPEVYAREFIESIYNKNNTTDSVLIASNSILSENKMTWKEKDKVILNAKKIVSRSGYSTIMDVYFLKCFAEFYPTKGQFEQEYLAKRHKKKLND